MKYLRYPTIIFRLPLLIFLLLDVIACKKLVEVDAPFTYLTSDNVYSTDVTAISELNGIYANMSKGGYSFETGSSGLSVLAGLSSDELTLFYQDATKSRFYRNALTAINDNFPWRGLYQCLLSVNTAIEKLSASNSLTPAVQQQLIGEAKFLRAFVYFYLVNLYGDIPLQTTSDYRINSSNSRSAKTEVYEQIVNDLKDAQNLLSSTYLDGTLLGSTTERVRPTKWAATALLARVFLYMGDWANAENQASTIITSNSLFSLSTLNNAFLKASLGNKEAIWQLQPVNSTWNTEDARVFVLTTTLSSGKPVYLDTLLVKSFESNDGRRVNWVKDTAFAGVKYSYPYKYKIATSNASVTSPSSVNEYLMVLRLGEQLLVRAEARAQQNNLSGAIDDLDKIRQRAGLPLYANTNPNISKSALLTAILHERQVELFTEWGHRWLDLKRTNILDAVMSVVTPLKGGIWSSNWALYPIPNYDILQNSNLQQNNGY